MNISDRMKTSPSYLGLQRMIEGIATIEVNSINEPELIYSGIMRFETGEQIDLQFTHQEIFDKMRGTNTSMQLWDMYPRELCELFVFRQFFKHALTHRLLNKASEQIN